VRVTTTFTLGSSGRRGPFTGHGSLDTCGYDTWNLYTSKGLLMRLLPRRRSAAAAAVAVIALAGCGGTGSPSGSGPTQPLSQFKDAVFFGDSLTDAGTYGFRFTTNPGMTWAQHVAEQLGQSTEPNEHVASYGDVYQGKPGLNGPGGLNYAEGGARAKDPYSTVSQNPEGTPISTAVQLQHFLNQHGSFGPDQLVTLYVGTNDVAYNYDPTKNPTLAQALRDNLGPSPEVMASERARVQKAAEDEAHTASDMLAHGAEHLLVFKLFDLAVLPWFESNAARSYVHELTAAYNERLVALVPQGPRVQVLDTAAFVDDLLKNAAAYGFTHGANDDGCMQPGQDYCDADAWKSPDADRTYVFAAGEHFTTHAHELLAEYVTTHISKHDGQ
jgi:phospholipase/lecithinase/hemolysin